MLRAAHFSPVILLLAAFAAGCAPRHSAGAGLAGRFLPAGHPAMVLQIGHQSSIESLAFSPDGQTLVSGSRDRTVDVWNAQTGELKRILAGSNGPVSSVAVLPDGTVVAGGSGDTAIRVWNTRTGGLLRTLRGQADRVTTVASSPDGSTIAGASETVRPGYADGSVTLWDWRRGVRRTLATGIPIAALAFSPDGKQLAVAGDFLQQMPRQQWPVQVWDTKTGRLLRSLPEQNVVALQYLHDGTLVTGGEGNKVTFWAGTGKRLRTLTLALPVPAAWSSPVVTYPHIVTLQCLAVSPDGGKIAVGVGGTGENAAAIFDAAAGARLQTLTGFRTKVAAVAFSPDGETLATGTGDMQQEPSIGDIALWDVRSGRRRQAMNGDENGLSSVSFAGNGRTLATGSADHTARVWDASSGALLQTLTDPARVSVAALSPDGSTLATGNEDAAVRLWNVKTGKVNAVIDANTESVDSLAWSPDGRTLASGGGSLRSGDVKIWDGRTGRFLRRMAGASEGINTVAFSPSGRQVAAGSDDNTVKIWEAGTGKWERTLDGYDGFVETVAFSPDGKWIAAGQDSRPGGEFKIWDAHTGRLEHDWTHLPYSVNNAAFSPDGRQIALVCRLDDQRSSTDDTCVLEIWDRQTGKRLRTLPGLRCGAYSLAYAPNGQSLLTAGTDGAARLWDTRTGALRLTLRILPPGVAGQPSADWIAATPAGYYDGSPGAERFLRWRIGDGLFPADASAAQFRRPDQIQKALRGAI